MFYSLKLLSIFQSKFLSQARAFLFLLFIFWCEQQLSNFRIFGIHWAPVKMKTLLVFSRNNTRNLVYLDFNIINSKPLTEEASFQSANVTHLWRNSVGGGKCLFPVRWQQPFYWPALRASKTPQYAKDQQKLHKLQEQSTFPPSKHRAYRPITRGHQQKLLYTRHLRHSTEPTAFHHLPLDKVLHNVPQSFQNSSPKCTRGQRQQEMAQTTACTLLSPSWQSRCFKIARREHTTSDTLSALLTLRKRVAGRKAEQLTWRLSENCPNAPPSPSGTVTEYKGTQVVHSAQAPFSPTLHILKHTVNISQSTARPASGRVAK